MVRPTTSQAVTALLAGLLLLSIGSTTALASADADATAEDGDVVELGSHDVHLADTTLHVEDLHLRGDGLPQKSVDEADVTLDGETTIDGVTVTLNGQTYQVGRVTVTLDDVGVSVEDVSIGAAA
jgi:hypothetical protein